MMTQQKNPWDATYSDALQDLRFAENCGYSITNDGSVIGKHGRKMATSENMVYYSFNIFDNGICKNVKIHRLVAAKYVPNPNNHNFVNHIDGDKHNNYYKNLEWVTKSQNAIHAYSIGLMKGCWKDKRGSDHFCSKPVIQYDLQGNKLGEFESITHAAKITGRSYVTIEKSLKGIPIRNFIWKYKITIGNNENKNLYKINE